MPYPRPTDPVRAQIVARLEQLQFAVGDGVLETILIRDGHYIGRRFRVDGAHAVWIHAEPDIRFWSDAGELLDVLKLDAGNPERVVA